MSDDEAVAMVPDDWYLEEYTGPRDVPEVVWRGGIPHRIVFYLDGTVGIEELEPTDTVKASGAPVPSRKSKRA